MSRKIKVLYIHHGAGIGGAPISLLNLIKNLDKNKFSYKIAFVKDSVAKDLFIDEGYDVEVIDNAPGVYFGHHEKGRIPIWNVFLMIKAWKNWKQTVIKIAKEYFEKNMDYDVIHLNSDVLSSWAVAAHNLGFKVVCHNRDPIAKGNLGIRRKLLRSILDKSVDWFISISEDNKKRLGFENKTSVVYNFITIPEQYRETRLLRSPMKLLYLGGQAKVKGFQTIVGALPLLKENIIVQFAGVYGNYDLNPNSIVGRIKNLIKITAYRSIYSPLKKMYQSENAEYLGLLKKPLPYIDECDALVSPFKVEHFSRPVMEAFAFGKPVVVSNVEGMSEIVEHGVDGLIFNKNDHKSLAESINRLYDNVELMKTMAQNARKKAEQKFDPKKNTAQVESIYLRLTKESFIK